MEVEKATHKTKSIYLNSTSGTGVVHARGYPGRGQHTSDYQVLLLRYLHNDSENLRAVLHCCALLQIVMEVLRWRRKEEFEHAHTFGLSIITNIMV